jgi:mycothiol S-conjugate amidase
MDGRLRLLTVHAHPDDESSKGAGTVARYHAEGIETALVCCTGGEQGDILNPAMDSPEVRADLPAVRRRELEAATRVIGYDHVEMLGYRDSGMAGTPSNEHPDAFAGSDDDEAVGRLVAVLRRQRPHVVITYGDDQEIYPHPDHLRAHDIGVAAFEAAGNADAFPEAGAPWEPAKLYYSVWPLAKLRMLHDALLQLGVDSPFPPTLHSAPDTDHRITTTIDVRAWMHVRVEALRAHATQIDPASPMWFGMSAEADVAMNGSDEYILARSSVEVPPREDDLFTGLR